MKKQQIKKKTKTEKPKPQEVPLPDDQKPFDFGGLPIRDIKKNLGCG